MISDIDNILEKYPANSSYKSTLYNKDIDIKNWIYNRFKNSNEDFMKTFDNKTKTGIEKFNKINQVFNTLDKAIELFKNDLIYIISEICKEFLPNIPTDTIQFILQKHDFGLKIESIKTSAKYRVMRGENIGYIHRDININDIYFEVCFALYDIIKNL
jgi:hypothetical protein